MPFFIVAEKSEAALYAEKFGESSVLALPFDNGGSSIPARNWIKEHAIKSGHLRHWQLDDNMKMIRKWGKTPWGRLKRIRCNAGPALRATEDFADRYENVAIAGLNYTMFAITGGAIPHPKPFFLNVHVYSCTLVLNSLPYKWRGPYNEDTDLCLQALAGGWCTILMNVFTVDKLATMTLKGGNTATLYKGDGRLKMARHLERLWPRTVYVSRRFKRPQHIIRGNWELFDNALIRKPEYAKLPDVPNEYGLQLQIK